MNSLAVVAMGGAAAEAMHYQEVAACLGTHCTMRPGWMSQLLACGAQGPATCPCAHVSMLFMTSIGYYIAALFLALVLL